MRVLWLCNIVLPELCEVFGFKKLPFGGWLSGIWSELKGHKGIDLGICLPIRNKKFMKDGFYNGYEYYSFPFFDDIEGVDIQVDYFKGIISKYNPDVIHIWGTEFIHTYSMIRACKDIGMEQKAIISIQGLVSLVGKLFNFGIPDSFFAMEIKGKSLKLQKDSYTARSKYEIESLRLVRQVFGRTDWDRACSLEINSGIRYFTCGAILRNEFYHTDKWNYGNALKHRIFISYASSPIKGLHMILRHLSLLKRKYDDLKVVIAGDDLCVTDTPYSVYIRELIYKFEMTDTIEFVGFLDASGMIKEYLKANIFLLPSLIENESNSTCEAMMIGTPVVASYVGGVGTVVQHNINGLLYPLNEPELMMYYITRIFDDRITAERLSREGIKRAEQFNDKNKIMEDLLEGYNEINRRTQ